MAKLKSKSLLSRLVLTLVVALCPGLAQAQDYSFRLRNQPAPQAYAQLRDASMFSLGGVGFAAMLTAEEKAFHVILNSETAIPQFQRLLKEANPEGQMYALYGLYLKDPLLFKPAAARLKLDDPPARREKLIFLEKGRIQFANGCLVGLNPHRNEIIERMATGEFDQAFKARSPQASPSLRVETQPLKY